MFLPKIPLGFPTLSPLPPPKVNSYTPFKTSFNVTSSQALVGRAHFSLPCSPTAVALSLGYSPEQYVIMDLRIRLSD